MLRLLQMKLKISKSPLILNVYLIYLSFLHFKYVVMISIMANKCCVFVKLIIGYWVLESRNDLYKANIFA